MEQQEHLKSMIAAAVAEAMIAHSSKDQRSQEDVNKTSKQNDANEHKDRARFESPAAAGYTTWQQVASGHGAPVTVRRSQTALRQKLERWEL